MATYESDPKRSDWARSETARRQGIRVERYGSRHGNGLVRRDRAGKPEVGA